MPADPRFTVSAYLMPMWIALAVSLIALFCLPVPFVRDRESHWLRRISTTPAPPSWLLGAHTVVNLVLALLAVAVLTIGGGAFLGMAAPDQLAGYVVAALLLVTAMFAVGLLVNAVAPTPGVAAGLGNAVYILLLFFGGLWIQRQDMAPALRAISDFTPLMAAGQALRGAMIGIFPTASQLLVLVGWTVVCGAAAIRFFRWE
jgi:ABC-2 type transport system permease protein